MKLPNPFKKASDNPSDVQLSVAGGMLAADSQRSTSEIELQKELGTNFFMAENEYLMADLTKLAERHYKVVVYDATGIVLRDKDGQPVFEDRVFFHPVFMTLKVEINRIHCMRWLDPSDAVIAMLKVKGNFMEQKMKLTLEEFEQWGGFIDALERIALGAISDSVNGRKPKLLKVQPRTFEVQFNKPHKPGEPGQGGFMP